MQVARAGGGRSSREKIMPVIVKHKCGAMLELTLDMAGKVGTCPSCGGTLTIPEHDELRAMMQEARARHLHHEMEETAAALPPPVKSPSPPKQATPAKPADDLYAQIHFIDEEPPPRPTKLHCPNCNHDMPPEGIICVNCGMNLKTGQKLGTKVAKPPAPPPETKIPAPNHKPHEKKPE